MRRLALCSLLAIAGFSAAAEAQVWKPIGRTKRDSVDVFIQTRSVKRAGDTVTALALTRFRPQWDPGRKDTIRAITTLVTFNCRLDKVVVKETIWYVDFDKKRIADRRKLARPGYGAVASAAFELVRDDLCPRVTK
jgi:hypothetical protein